MARSIAVLDRSPLETHDAVIAGYRERLSRLEPELEYQWPPVCIGPTWQRGPDGRFILPEHSIGWDVLGWCGTWLQHSRGVPWQFTNEQARFVLWWYAIDDEGRFLYHDGVFQRLKGHGKDPLGACLMAVEMLGPCRFDGWDENGEPLARDVPDAWVQTAAVSLDQTKNTMRLLPALFTAEAKRHFELFIGKEKVYALGDQRYLEAVTSAPATLEGARATMVIINESHLWKENNDGHEMSAVIARNAAKSPDGGARTLRITNAYEPGEDSVAERDRDAWVKISGGQSLGSGLLYDSLEAAPDAPLSAEATPEVVRSIRGDSVWLNPERIVQEILDPRNPPSRSRRFWYNQITAAEDAWLSPQEWDRLADTGYTVPLGAEIALAFDGSLTDDHCSLAGVEIATGFVFTLGIWDPADYGGEAPRELIDEAVARAFAVYDVVGFYSDLHPWESYVDKWTQEFGANLCVKSSVHGPIAWDMRGRQAAFTVAAETFTAAVLASDFKHDGHRIAAQHVHNARRRPNRWGVGLGKEHRESSRKIDFAVTAVLARMCRQDYMALPDSRKRRRRTGRAVFA